ncbi:rhodanese-like domain-containing protein 11, chloroplastic isoform X2 [Ziziphus jujuba]|uniref:Rhodanese-like domain-containing protein 11, chloroplastic isoform X2 n=1 Tax=Ziziphus jujuba TaxID=326968 RepID=A0ABM3ZZT9_ZIZJJ|nr:rhodanese-like domain-containing protein 11, chloroplastic isoform X2 [Ziziphus jujuba]
MEALGLPCLNTISLSCCSNSVSQKQKLNHFFSKGTFCRNTYGLSSSSSPKLMPTYGTRRFQWRTIRMQADDEDYELKQTKDMTAARKRWEALVREEKVKVLTPREAGYAIQLSNKTLLDVRPSTEHEKAWVKGSTWIPIFEVDNRLDPGTVSRKITSFVMGGWWSGVPTLTYDSRFLSKVEEKFPKETDLIVACQKGLRSLAACELLYNAGYRNLFWLQGGLESAEEEDLIREGPLPFKFAGIGGVSEFLGYHKTLNILILQTCITKRLIY